MVMNCDFLRKGSKFWILIFLFSCFFLLRINESVEAQNSGYEESVKSYIQTYRDIAVKEMMVYRIPASITLAQGIYESNAGKSRLSSEANNHFGIKCHADWTGPTFTQDDETKDECFRKYNNPEESFRDHSLYLAKHDRYKSLFALDINDYKGWANGLKACGYATNPQYADHLIKTIEDYQLTQFDVADFSLISDSLVSAKDSVRATEVNKHYDLFAEGQGKRMVYLNNGLQFIMVRKNDNIKNIAKAFRISERKIRKFNDMKNDAPLIAGQMVYLEPKKRKAAISHHVVKHGETMYTISQTYGIELSQLYKINKIKAGHPVKQGQKISLR
jgi:LysM repeat protein